MEERADVHPEAFGKAGNHQDIRQTGAAFPAGDAEEAAPEEDEAEEAAPEEGEAEEAAPEEAEAEAPAPEEGSNEEAKDPAESATEPKEEGLEWEKSATNASEITVSTQEESNSDVVTFAYTGDVQTFTAPADGYYKLEAWGAQGGTTSKGKSGGKGGYSTGVIYLTKDTTLSVYVGGAGGATDGGWNGGGKDVVGKKTDQQQQQGRSGGGATDFRVSGDTLYHRVLVAGGGGGAVQFSIGYQNGQYKYAGADGGTGGGLNGGQGVAGSAGKAGGYGGTQTAGGEAGYGKAANGNAGAFGNGGDTTGSSNNAPGGGGGGGWFGGGSGGRGNAASAASKATSGGGGSGFVFTGGTPIEGYLVDEQYALTTTSMSNGQQTGNGQARVTIVPHSVSYVANGGTGTMNIDHYASGNTVTVAENGFIAPTSKQFAGWNTKADGNGTPYAKGATFTMGTEDIVLYAQWEFIPVSGISLNKTEVGLGLEGSETLIATVSPDEAADKSVVWKSSAPEVVAVDADGVITALAKGRATITATATNGTETTDDDYSADCTVVVAYAINIAATNGTVAASKMAGLQCGDEVTLTVMPKEGYALETLTVKDTNDTDVAVNDNKFNMPDSDVTVTATFKAIDYNVIIEETANGTVIASKTSKAHVDDEITLTVAPNENCGLKSLSCTYGEGITVPLTPGTEEKIYQITMPAGDVTVTASFQKLSAYTVLYREPDVANSVTEPENAYAFNLATKMCIKNAVYWTTSFNAAEGVTSLPAVFSTDGGTNWSAVLDVQVVDSIPATLNPGEAVILNGELQVYAVAFVTGGISSTSTNENVKVDGASYILIDSNTTSVPCKTPTKEGYDFDGWEYYATENNQKVAKVKQITNGQVDVSDITETTVFTARWKKQTSTVTFNLDGGSGSAANQTVAYGDKVSKPANPTRDGYAFNGWVVSGKAVEMIGDKEGTLSNGTAFDFNQIKITHNLTLKATWKHVHTYLRLELDDPMFGGAFNDLVNQGYGSYMHIKICRNGDDYCGEAHSFNGLMCACGYSKLGKTVKLTQKIDDKELESRVIQNSVATIRAPSTSGDKEFSKWQYSTNGSNWYDLSASPAISFAVPCALTVKAAYEKPKVELAVKSFLYKKDNKDHLAFQFIYQVPKNLTVVGAGLLTGNNENIQYYEGKRSSEYPEPTLTGVVTWLAPIPDYEEVRYELSPNNAVKNVGARTVAEKMFRDEAIGISGYSHPNESKPATLGSSGSVACLYGPNAINGNAFHYGMGYVVVKDKSGNMAIWMTDAIAATKKDPNHVETTKGA